MEDKIQTPQTPNPTPTSSVHPTAEEMVASVIRMCNDGSVFHGQWTKNVLEAEKHLDKSAEHFDKGKEEIRAAKEALEASLASGLQGGGMFSAIRHYVSGAGTGTGSGVNKIPKPISAILLMILGVSMLTIAAGPKKDTVVLERPMSVRDGMVAQAKVEMGRKDVERKVALTNAEVTFSRVANTYGLDNDLFCDLAFCRMEMGNTKGVEELCARMEKLNPLCPFIFTFRGQIYLGKGDKEKARKAFETAVLYGDKDAVLQLRRIK